MGALRQGTPAQSGVFGPRVLVLAATPLSLTIAASTNYARFILHLTVTTQIQKT
jgi:hypothetical protein